MPVSAQLNGASARLRILSGVRLAVQAESGTASEILPVRVTIRGINVVHTDFMFPFFRYSFCCNRGIPRIPALIVVTGTLTIAAAACTTEARQPPVSSDIRGVVTGILHVNDQLRSRGVLAFLRIEGQRDSTVRYDRADVAVTDTTQIYRKLQGGLKPAEFDALREGMRVEATFTGPVLERYPVQATAGRLVIVE